MRTRRWLVIGGALAMASLVGSACFYSRVANPRVVRELRANPQGERAGKVMVLTLPSGKSLPVNYLRDGDTVYAAADFPWWRGIPDGGGPGRVWIRGETLRGHVRAERDDEALRDSVFERLRPSAPRFFGTLIVVELEPDGGHGAP